jgi:low affinity Fe/Cu permease
MKGNFFDKVATKTARTCGHPLSFISCLFIILIWSSTGPIFAFSDTWQLIINTGTTIVTFLMVFLIQNSQNRDAEAMQIKLDELIRCNNKAHNALLDLESLTIEELDDIKDKYKELAAEAREGFKDHKDITFQEINLEDDFE